MGVFTIEYENVIKPNLLRAIDNALDTEVKDVALQAIEASAMHGIYMDYTPQPTFQESRRYSFIQDDNYETSVNDNTLTITARSKLQNLFGDSHNEDLGDIVAEGWSNFHQPFARPWMDKGVEANLPEIEKALMRGLERQGF